MFASLISRTKLHTLRTADRTLGNTDLDKHKMGILNFIADVFHKRNVTTCQLSGKGQNYEFHNGENQKEH